MSGKRVKKLRKAFEQHSGLKMGIDEESKLLYKTTWRKFKKSIKRKY